MQASFRKCYIVCSGSFHCILFVVFFALISFRFHWFHSFHFHCVIVQTEEGFSTGVSDVNSNDVNGKLAIYHKFDDNKPSAGNQFGRISKKQTATVVITEGTSETRQLAKNTILDLANRGYAALLQAEGFGELSILVHPRFFSEITGPGGEIIKVIQLNLVLKLTIPKTDWTPKTIQVSSMWYIPRQ